MDTEPTTRPPLMRRWELWAAVIAAAALIAVFALVFVGRSDNKAEGETHTTPPPAAASASSSAAGAAQGAFGQTAYTNVGPDTAGTVKVVVNAPTITPKDAQSWPRQSGDKCVVFPVTVINNSASPLPFPGNWVLRGADGANYEKVTGCTSDDHFTVPDGGMQPQAVVSGQVAFIGPEHGVLMYKPPMSTIDTIDWTY